MSGHHCSVLFLIELYTQLIEPQDSLRSLCNKLCYKLRLCCEMSAAESVKEVYCRRIIGLVSSLDSALCHHSVCVAYTELCDDHCLYSGLVSLDSCGCTCSAAAYDEHICLIVRLCEVYISCGNAALAL